MQEVWVTNAVLMLAVFMLLMVFYVTGELTSNGFNYEVQALMDIKMQLIDPQNALSNWDSFAVDPCSWFHVTCSVEQSVINLGVAGFGLSGTLSSSVGNLSNLESLSLENNNLAGRLPPDLGKLVKLSSLDLSNNYLSGEIPQSLGQMKSLSSLRLNNNNLSGDFPSSLVNIPRLDYVDLSNNNLSGHVPLLSARTLNIVGNPQLCGYPAYQKCSGDPPLPMMAARKGTGSIVRSRKIAIAVGTTGFSLIVLFLFAAAILWRRQHNQQIFYDAYEQQGTEVALGQLKRFSFRELQIATDNFHIRNILGRGGFGNVYKSRLSDGSLVAVKRLKDRVTAGGELQFQMEMEIISLAVHKNLLRLLGYCVTSTERLLIYPYMPNGSVASRLREKPALDWHTRKRIALGVARGLLYLHEQCDPKIIHRDVKAANILLDEDYEAVVGDFGLAKLLDHKESHVTTVVRGTVGHIAPEYLSKGQSSEKTDVFGFGILLLELIVGDFGHLSNKKGYVLLECVKRLQQEKRLIELVDPEIKANYNTVELEQIVQVALLCTQFSPVDRPKMSEVLQMLAGEGLAEHWDAWQKTKASRSQLGELRSPRYLILIGDSSCSGGLPCTLLQASELSGPR